MLQYKFENKLMWGKEEPLIMVSQPYEMLYDLSSQWLSTINGVKEVIDNLQKVLASELDIYKWGGSDYCIIHSYKERSLIIYDFGENETETATADLLKLMQDWKTYLEANLK